MGRDRIMVLAFLAVIMSGCGSSKSPGYRPGTLDTTFNPPFGFAAFSPRAGSDASATRMTVQPDDKIVLAGWWNAGNYEDALLVRYTPNGSLDSDFGTGGYTTFNFTGNSNDKAFGVCLQPDGKIVVAGYATTSAKRNVLILRYNANGTLDNTFGNGGVVTYNDPLNGTDIGFGVAVQADGGIVVTGEADFASEQNALVLRYNSNGTLDPSFANAGVFMYHAIPNGIDRGFSLALQPDDKIVVSGSSFDGASDNALLLRLNSDGSLDGNFGIGGLVTYSGGANSDNYGDKVLVQSDNKLVVIGATGNGSDFAMLVLRYNSDGSPDSGFGSDGAVTFAGSAGGYNYAFGGALQQNGEILVGGTSFNGTNDAATILRYEPNGALDAGFGSHGVATYSGTGSGGAEIAGLGIQSGGRIIAAGYASNGTNEQMLVMRLLD